MSRTIDDFMGEWHVRWVAGVLLVIEPGYKLHIGPRIDDSHVEGTLFAPTPEGWTPVRSSAELGGPLTLVDGSLFWEGPTVDDPELPTRIYISIAEGVTPNGSFRSLYGTTLRGDPEQVVVWGANDTPP